MNWREPSGASGEGGKVGDRQTTRAVTRCGCFLPDLTGLARRPSTADLPRAAYHALGGGGKVGSRADCGRWRTKAISRRRHAAACSSWRCKHAQHLAKSQGRQATVRRQPMTRKQQLAPPDHPIADAIIGGCGSRSFSVFLHSPKLAGRLAHLGAFVRFEGTLDMRVRVLAALTVGPEFEAAYIWGPKLASLGSETWPKPRSPRSGTTAPTVLRPRIRWSPNSPEHCYDGTA